MEFIAAANRGGYRPLGREINQWRVAPDPKPTRPGKLLVPGVPAVPSRRVKKSPIGGLLVQNQRSVIGAGLQTLIDRMNPTVNMMASLQAGISLANSGFMDTHYETIPGTPGRPAEYAPDKPAEKFLAHLRRLGWIERNSGRRYGVTPLGHALLRAEASSDVGDEESSVIVLTAGDELAYGRVLGVIADCGEALIVDGYLGTAELVHILNHTSASRFLVGSRLSEGRLAELAIQIQMTPTKDDVIRELRVTNDLHDRYLVGEHKIYGLGASLNGVGKGKMTTLVELPDMAAHVVRAEVERLWASARVVVSTIQTSDDGGGPSDDVETNVFRHGGCQVKHRSQAAMARCRNGSDTPS